jgi:ParB-like chromosome segregation protein Spo0J
MNIETVHVDSLREDPANVRVHSKRNMQAIRNSLQAFGQQKPLVITDSGVIVAGNGTYAAARSLGWQEINVIRLPADWSKERITAFAIADNRTSELGEWDYGVLVDILGNLEENLVAAAGWDESGLKFLLEPPEKVEPHAAADNAAVNKSYEDNFKDYEQAETRSILLDFPLHEYMRVIAQLDRAREAYNVTSNAEVVLMILTKHMEEA